jgi:ribonuclease-3
MPRHKPDLSALEARIGHIFQDRDLLTNALTHMSAAGGAYARSYQRLEFLGDRVLGLAIAELLYAAFHDGSEGDLSRRLSELVRRETCADIAEAWELGPHIRTGSKEAAIRKNRSVLADVTEAVIGAVFLEAGYPAARAVVEKAFGPRMQAFAKPPSNPKAVLQEWALARNLPVPVYEIVEQFGPHHAPKFRMSVRVQGLEPAEGTGSSKRAAEQDAAESLLARESLWERPAMLEAKNAETPETAGGAEGREEEDEATPRQVHVRADV